MRRSRTPRSLPEASKGPVKLPIKRPREDADTYTQVCSPAKTTRLEQRTYQHPLMRDRTSQKNQTEKPAEVIKKTAENRKQKAEDPKTGPEDRSINTRGQKPTQTARQTARKGTPSRKLAQKQQPRGQLGIEKFLTHIKRPASQDLGPQETPISSSKVKISYVESKSQGREGQTITCNSRGFNPDINHLGQGQDDQPEETQGPRKTRPVQL